MRTPLPPDEVIDTSFEEGAHTLGGFIAADGVGRSSAWKLMGEVCATWFRARSRVSREGADLSTELHPSVRSFIAAIRCER